jgi:predicted nucleic acid-binding protein
MVLVDTSVWISLYRQQRSDLAQKLWMLAARNEAAVSGQVWVEFLGGFRKQSERNAHFSKLAAFPFLDATRSMFDLAVELLSAHPGLGAGDAIIAATAIDSGSELFTLDRDFDQLAPKGLRLFS